MDSLASLDAIRYPDQIVFCFAIGAKKTNNLLYPNIYLLLFGFVSFTKKVWYMVSYVHKELGFGDLV